jgi:hypothetical protein
MKLVVFDVDGTLIDSQHMIVSSMNAGMEGPVCRRLPREAILSIVGLSLPVAIAATAARAVRRPPDKVEAGYRAAYMASRMHLESPLYPGAQDCLDALSARGDVLLAIATGKSRRGLDALIEIMAGGSVRQPPDLGFSPLEAASGDAAGGAGRGGRRRRAGLHGRRYRIRHRHGGRGGHAGLWRRMGLSPGPTGWSRPAPAWSRPITRP